MEHATGGHVAHLQSHAVKETYNGLTVWDGAVEEFATRDNGVAYGWKVNDGTGKAQYVTVLRKPPVDSPIAAVRVWIASQFDG